MKPKEQTKAITYKPDDDNDKTSTSKNIYHEILEEIIDEIIKMSKEISHANLVYDFKDPTPLINFGKYGSPMHIYVHMKNGEKNITTSRGRAKIFLKRFKPNNIRKSEV